MDRRTYSTMLVRADDLETGDVSKIDGTWCWVSGVWDHTNHDTAATEFGEDSEEYRAIRTIVNETPENGEGVYVAVRYLRTVINSVAGSSGYRYKPQEPSFRIAAYSQYELIETQKEN